MKGEFFVVQMNNEPHTVVDSVPHHSNVWRWGPPSRDGSVPSLADLLDDATCGIVIDR